MDMQGKYPVIYISFKDEKHSEWDRCLNSLERLVKSEFAKHSYILKSDVLEEYEKQEVLDILYGRASHDIYTDGLKLLSEYLYRYHKQKVVILVDEYDVPLQSGFLFGYYDKVIEFMRIFLSGGLKDKSEKVYHSFVLGMLVALSDDYEVRSNRESGYGRYDVMVIPRDLSKKGIIIEFKKVDEDEDLEAAAKSALKQIEEKQYRQELVDRGVKDIIELGIAFEGKVVLVKQKN